MKLSVAIPCWSMNGVGKNVLEYSLDIISRQTMKDFDVVVSKIEEQRKISDFFTNLDNLITLHQRELLS